jgi:hypothetical protein
MKVRLPVMIQDPSLSGHPGLRRIVEWVDVDDDDFGDGPACRRVAVQNRDWVSGDERPGIPFEAPRTGRKLGRYRIQDAEELRSTAFMAVSVFGTVLRTLQMFEEPDALGRKVSWAFDAPQLMVVPCAGEQPNAYYARHTRSLQFFCFADARGQGAPVFTALSRDIVCHETGHAVLDGIAPSLWSAITPQALALHEAVADLVAVVMSFRSRDLCEAVLAETRGSIENVSAFCSIGEEFGQAYSKLSCLRDLRSPLRMDQVDHAEPHALSQVLSAALYRVLTSMHDTWWRKLSGGDGTRDFSRSGKALAIAASHFKRMAFRALDYLPPGEASFADYGRAIVAADQASHPDSAQQRIEMAEEFVSRGIVERPDALDVETDYAHEITRHLDLHHLVASDDEANRFVDANRALLRIPAAAPFVVDPRLDVCKLYYHRGGQKRAVRECLLKVRWKETEASPPVAALPERREVTVGTTLAIDWETRRVRALLTSSLADRPQEADTQRDDRDRFLKALVAADALRIGAQNTRAACAPHECVIADVSSGVLRVVSAAPMFLAGRTSIAART